MRLFAINKPGKARFVLSWGLILSNRDEDPAVDCPDCGERWGHGVEYFSIWLRHYERRTYWLRNRKRRARCPIANDLDRDPYHCGVCGGPCRDETPSEER